MADNLGRCVQCDTDGPVGAPCQGTPRCSHDGYRFIPLADHAARYSGGRTILPEIGRQYGDFLVLRRLGEGGIGGVFLAVQPGVGLRAAVKLLTTKNPLLIEKFQLEAQALARLGHPHIVRLLGFGEAHGQQYLAMELVEGQTLTALAKAGLTAAEVLELLRQLGDGLVAAHAAGLVHRDIKPDNVMVQALPRRGWFVRLVDFGLAKDSSDDKTNVAAGTPPYMAPEQFEQRGIGPWTDVYAVGVLSVAASSGTRPSGMGRSRPTAKKNNDSSQCPRAAPAGRRGRAARPPWRRIRQRDRACSLPGRPGGGPDGHPAAPRTCWSPAGGGGAAAPAPAPSAGGHRDAALTGAAASAWPGDLGAPERPDAGVRALADA
ncbi:MAG: serine/threonine-protein kinase [bacterium]